MLEVRFALGSWTPGLSPLVASRQVRALAEVLVEVDLAYLSAHGAPWLYDSGVRYTHDTGDEFADVPTVLARGVGDCEDLAAWRVAELTMVGEPAAITVNYEQAPNVGPLGWKFHVLVRRADGTVEDPSALLGMHDRTR